MEREARDTRRDAALATSEEPTIVVPLDGTQGALAAVPVARALAELEHGTVHVVHVTDGELPPHELLEKVGLAPGQVADSVLRARTGSPAEEILRIAHERRDTVLVMCARTSARGPGREMGRVARAVLRGARVPIVFVNPARPLAPYVIRRIAFPHDGTPTTGVAITSACDLAARTRAELLVLHVAAAAGAREEPGSLDAPFYVDQPQHEWPAWTREFLERLCASRQHPRISPRLLLLRGDPADALVRHATDHEVDLIVCGWRGSLEPSRAKVLRSLIERAPCPVLVLRVGGPT